MRKTDLLEVLGVLKRLTEKVKRANNIQHSGGRIAAEDWSELYMLTNESESVLSFWESRNIKPRRKQ